MQDDKTPVAEHSQDSDSVMESELSSKLFAQPSQPLRRLRRLCDASGGQEEQDLASDRSEASKSHATDLEDSAMVSSFWYLFVLNHSQCRPIPKRTGMP